jgi:hypothetical protein
MFIFEKFSTFEYADPEESRLEIAGNMLIDNDKSYRIAMKKADSFFAWIRIPCFYSIGNNG